MTLAMIIEANSNGEAGRRGKKSAINHRKNARRIIQIEIKPTQALFFHSHFIHSTFFFSHKQQLCHLKNAPNEGCEGWRRRFFSISSSYLKNCKQRHEQFFAWALIMLIVAGKKIVNLVYGSKKSFTFDSSIRFFVFYMIAWEFNWLLFSEQNFFTFPDWIISSRGA